MPLSMEQGKMSLQESFMAVTGQRQGEQRKALPTMM